MYTDLNLRKIKSFFTLFLLLLISLLTLSLLFFTLFFINFQKYHPLPECACGGCVYDVAKRALEAREKEKLFGFLMGLDRKLGKGMARIMLMKPCLSFNESYSLLVNWTTSWTLSHFILFVRSYSNHIFYSFADLYENSPKKLGFAKIMFYIASTSTFFFSQIIYYLSMYIKLVFFLLLTSGGAFATRVIHVFFFTF